jgi:hypothetical protein
MIARGLEGRKRAGAPVKIKTLPLLCPGRHEALNPDLKE